jgi:hypothetical protein
VTPPLHDVHCPDCDERVDHIGDGLGSVDPVTFEQVFTCRPCGHRVDRPFAVAAHTAGVRVDVPKVSAASIVAAEQARARAKGHTPEADAALTGGQLAWATWALIDDAASDAVPSPTPPSMWPLPPGRWPADESALRELVIAAGFLLSEIDRRLGNGETP